MEINTLDIDRLRKNIVQLINQSRLPIGIVYYLLKDITNEASLLYNNQLAQDITSENSKKNKEESSSEV